MVGKLEVGVGVIHKREKALYCSSVVRYNVYQKLYLDIAMVEQTVRV